MENNEKKGVPEISFAPIGAKKAEASADESKFHNAVKSAENDNAEKAKASVAVKPPEKGNSDEVHSKKTEKKSPGKEVMKRISEHEALLDKALYDFEQGSNSDDTPPAEGEVGIKTDSASDKSIPKQSDNESEPNDVKPVIPTEKKARQNPTSAGKKVHGDSRKGKKKKKKKRFNVSIIGGLTITIVIMSISLVLSLGAITLGMEYLGINKEDKEITFNIPSGSTTDEIIDLLIDNDIINNKTLFKAVLKLNHDPTLYPGDITLSQNLSYPDIIDKLGEMRESYETVTITIHEGAGLLAIANKLEKNGVCSAEDFLFQFNAEQDLELDSKVDSSEDAYYSMEGYFFPDTYEFYVGDSAYNVTKIVRENFESKITDEMYERMDELGMTLNEVITLASIVQKEAGTVEDMPIVASVFLNRLNNPDEFPQLQSDATMNYVEKTIKKAETSTALIEHYENCYDTYTCIGLPAGPIGNPGLDAINAVLYAEDTDYYYFCNNLETGEAYYAETYKEHKKNLKKAGLTE